ncbi:septum formation initiator family protein [Patescibacteria group bacterium]
MKKFIPKHRWQNVVFSKAALVLLFIVILFAGNAAWNMYQKYRESKELKDRALTQLHELENRKQNLTENIEKLETERGIEEELRKRFGIVKEGEEVVIVIDNPEDKENEQRTVEKKSFLNNILDIFKHD